MHFSTAINPPADPTAEQHFALRTLIRYLWAFHDKSPAVMANLNDHLSHNDVENYLNRPGKKASTINPPFQKLFKRVREILNTFETLPLSAALLPIASILYSPAADTSGLIASSPLETDLRSWQNASKAYEHEVLSRIVGMWWVVRISTTKWTNPEVPEFNISLLNVFAPGFRSELMPNCRLYTRGKYVRGQYNSKDGFILVRSSRIYVVGHTSAIDRFPFLLSLAYSGVERNGQDPWPHLTHTSGQLLSVNSNHITISSHVIAEFIPGTGDIADPIAYEARKVAEREHIGVYDLNELSKIVKDPSQVESLLQWSKDEMVLMMKS